MNIGTKYILTIETTLNNNILLMIEFTYTGNHGNRRNCIVNSLIETTDFFHDYMPGTLFQLDEKLKILTINDHVVFGYFLIENMKKDDFYYLISSDKITKYYLSIKLKQKTPFSDDFNDDKLKIVSKV